MGLFYNITTKHSKYIYAPLGSVGKTGFASINGISLSTLQTINNSSAIEEITLENSKATLVKQSPSDQIEPKLFKFLMNASQSIANNLPGNKVNNLFKLLN